jgi:hypothetical protein
MISIRVSPDEYSKLRAACTAEGVASVSELARVAMDAVLKRHAGPGPVTDQLVDLRDRVAILAAEIDRLARSLSQPEPADAGRAASAD